MQCSVFSSEICSLYGFAQLDLSGNCRSIMPLLTELAAISPPGINF
jgi:hypothetical protein